MRIVVIRTPDKQTWTAHCADCTGTILRDFPYGISTTRRFAAMNLIATLKGELEQLRQLGRTKQYSAYQGFIETAEFWLRRN